MDPNILEKQILNYVVQGLICKKIITISNNNVDQFNLKVIKKQLFYHKLNETNYNRQVENCGDRIQFNK